MDRRGVHSQGFSPIPARLGLSGGQTDRRRKIKPDRHPSPPFSGMMDDRLFAAYPLRRYTGRSGLAAVIAQRPPPTLSRPCGDPLSRRKSTQRVVSCISAYAARRGRRDRQGREGRRDLQATDRQDGAGRHELAKEKGPPRLCGAALAHSGPSPAGSAAGRGDQPEGVSVPPQVGRRWIRMRWVGLAPSTMTQARRGTLPVEGDGFYPSRS